MRLEPVPESVAHPRQQKQIGVGFERTENVGKRGDPPSQTRADAGKQFDLPRDVMSAEICPSRRRVDEATPCSSVRDRLAIDVIFAVDREQN